MSYHRIIRQTLARHNNSSAPPRTFNPLRKFSISRRKIAARDASTIDFMSFPEIQPHLEEDIIRVPLLPTTARAGVNYAQIEAVRDELEHQSVMRPEISLVSADGTYFHAPSPMSEVHDNNAITFEGIEHKSDRAKLSHASSSVLKRFWNGLLDDVFGGDEDTKWGSFG